MKQSGELCWILSIIGARAIQVHSWIMKFCDNLHDCKLDQFIILDTHHTQKLQLGS